MRTTLLLLCALASAARAEPSPMRPAPVPSSRPPATGTIRHVDAARGADTNDGSAGAPWKTINTAIGKLKAGDTLYLHGGTYFEAVAVTTGGITIRSAPGELATIDGGLPEFQRTPATAWEPLANGEYRSTATYPALSKGPSEQGRGVWITGNFASSMVPLHGYRLVEDLRSKNEYFDFPGDNLAPRAGIYVGPGVWLDRTTHRIHARFAPTTLRSQPVNYAGGDDPRKLALVIGADRIPLSITASHVRIQDLVVRGSATHTVHVDKASHVELDGLTIFGGSPALWVEAAGNFKLVRSTVRGLAAPWSSRAGMKYRGNSPYLVIASSRGAQSHDWELAYNDFVDSHDGLVLDSVRSLRFHHNLVDNFNDDAVYLTFPPRVAPGDDQQYYENVFARAISTFAFAQDSGANSIGPGVYIFRNVFDLRAGTYSWPPKDAAEDVAGRPLAISRTCGDHGSPTWDPMFIYQNTILTPGPAHRDYYGANFVAGTGGSTRRLFNNLFVQDSGTPGLVIPRAQDDLELDGNLMWSIAAGPHADFFAAFRAGAVFTASKQRYAPGWGASDVYADPRLVRTTGALDARLGPGSAAIDAGIAIPSAWPDTLRAADKGKPDIGALPAGAPMLRVGPSAAPKP